MPHKGSSGSSIGHDADTHSLGWKGNVLLGGCYIDSAIGSQDSYLNKAESSSYNTLLLDGLLGSGYSSV